MPRTSIWFNQEQLDEVHEAFGDAVNLSGVVRASLSLLLYHAGRDRGGTLKREVWVLSDITNAQEVAASMLAELDVRAPRKRRSS